ncbi:MAG: ribonuclease HII [Micavibrio aeruginosavorus]|uniref:Ribonuclease HII n=1 Tax=Micavibrio aeruginosavorus TaxID=349221 RepID=A0A2W5C0Q4_9BACT|nr:MAG: ribonuclease HII [Micavibrio aeruginosavorus]
MSLKSSAKALMPDIAAFDAAFGIPVCGIDEVGRGPLAGPVVTACAFIPADKIGHPVWAQVTDSKKLSAVKRDYLFEIIKDQCVYAVAEASAEEIDTLNIHHATLLAMKRAYEGVHGRINITLALIDGKFAPALPCKTQTVVKGDSQSLSIAAASIIAKVTRDRMMMTLHTQFPHYGWDTNAGYGTATHMNGIAQHGITLHHRKSFAPCKAA